jgi:hypothetical protein
MKITLINDAFFFAILENQIDVINKNLSANMRKKYYMIELSFPNYIFPLFFGTKLSHFFYVIFFAPKRSNAQ